MVAQQSDLVVAKSLSLSVASDGFDGQLELLEDARLTLDLEKTLWGSGGPEMALDENDPRYSNFTSVPLRKAVLRLRDTHRTVVAEKTLEREQARIRFEQLHPGSRTILVTTDLSAGFGSYAGPLTELLEVNGSRLETVVSRNAESELTEPIRLKSTLKTAWKLVPAIAGQNNQKDILEVACRPDFDSKESKFFVTYTRYHWDKKGWIVVILRVHGFWEDEGTFPASERFPSATEPKSQ
jgi:hypothetical protein